MATLRYRFFPHLMAFCFALAVLSPGLSAQAEEGNQEPGDTLHIPGLPPVPMPPGAHGYPEADPGFGHSFGYRGHSRGADQLPPTVIGPGGVVRPMPRPDAQQARRPPPKKVLTPAERAEQIRKALAPKPSLAFLRRHTLDDLYGKLAVAKDPDEAKGLASVIVGIWMRSGSDTANLLMQRALQAEAKQDYPVALDLLDRVVALKPGWAEAWNQRATVRFAQGNMDGSMSDVEHVLKLEPKHFGALDGMAAILQRTGFDKRALEVYRRALAIYPHQPEVEKMVDKLKLDVEGQGI